ncbi:MAG: DNA translocase FtsK 4TM domain-containing protein, partial [Clostridia bacterium]|nr:DNA translocase FtsK 4TM domain-containing protein [Clostridia bacterium]
MKLKRPSAYWAELDEKRRSQYRIVAAVLLGIFTLFTAIAVGSYFFTWKQDASLLSEPDLMGSEAAVSNAGSKLGFRWGRFLVTRSFGLAALGLVAFLVAWTLSRAVPKLRIPLGKWFVYSFTGTFVGSWLLALVSRLAGWDTLFGGGLGGRAGAALVDGSIDLVGFVVTAIVILALTGLWLYFLTDGFKSAAGEEEEIPGQAGNDKPLGRQAHQPAPEPAEEPEPAPVFVPKPEPKPEPVRVVQVSTPSPAEVAAEPAPEAEGTFTVETDDTLDQQVREPLPRIDNRADLPKYKFPTLDILGDYLNARHEPSQDELNRNNNKIRATLASYKIQVKDVTAIVGPTVTLYKVYPAPGVKIASIKMLQDDIAISLNAKGVRIVTLSDSVGIEVANDTPSIVPL